MFLTSRRSVIIQLTVIVVTVLSLVRFPVILSLVMVCKLMQQLPTILGPAVYRGRDTTYETFLNTLILSWRLRNPNNVGRAVQTDPTLLRYASMITDQRNVGSCSLKSLTGLKLRFAQQHAKECENGRNM